MNEQANVGHALNTFDPNVKNYRFSLKNDIWSVAIVFINIFLNLDPDPNQFENSAYIQQIIDQNIMEKLNTYDNLKDRTKEKIIALLKNMTKLDLNERYDVFQCLEFFIE